MNIDALKKLERQATPAPWKETGNGSMIEAPGEPYPVAKVYGYGRFNRKHSKVEADGRMIAAFRNLAPELIALWEAANNDGTMRKETWDALQALNTKSAAMVG